MSWLSHQLARLTAVALGEELIERAAPVFTLRVVFAGLELLGALVLARVFNAHGYGIYAFVVSWVGVVGVPAAVGFDRLLIREIATFKARGDWASVRGILSCGTRVVLFVSIALGAAMAGGAVLWAADADVETVAAMAIGMVLVPIVAYARLRQAALQGLGRLVAGQLPEAVIQPGLLLLLVGGLYLVPAIPRVGATAIALNVIAGTCACLVGIRLLRRSLPAGTGAAQPGFTSRVWLFRALPFVWILSMNALMMHADVILLGMLDTTESAGVFRVTGQVAALVAFPLSVVNTALAPTIAATYAAGNHELLQRQVTRASRLTLTFSLPIFVVLLLFGDHVLALFGSSFTAGHRSLLILIAGQLMSAATGSVGYLLIMTKYEREAATGFAFAAGLNLLLNAILIPRWGMEGAAIASCTALVFLNARFAWLVRARIGLHTTALGPSVRRSES